MTIARVVVLVILYGIYITIYLRRVKTFSDVPYSDTLSVLEANPIVVYSSDLHPGANYK